MSNSVAEKCGILSGDKIVEISNKEISTFSQAAEIVLENPNNKLNFLVERIVDSKIEYIKLNMIPKKYKNFHPLSKKKIIGKIGVMPVIEKPIILVPYENSLAFKYGMRDFDKIISIKRAKATSFVDIKNHLFLSKKNSFRVQRRIDGKIFKIKINSFFSKFKEEHKKAEIYFHSIMSYEKKNKKIINKIIKAKKNIFDFEKRIMLQNGIIFSGGGVVKVEDESLSKRLGILSGDKLISINNKKITSLSILEQELFYGGSNIHVISIIGNNRSKILIFRFEKKEKINLRFSITKEFGLSFASSYKQGYTFFRHVGVLESLNVALFQTFDLIKIMIKSFLALFSFKISLSQLGGPITIFDIAGQASSISLRFYFYIMAMLSVNLGLLNLLPIPVLDGGHLMFFAIEAWRKKEISIKYKEIALIIGTIFILFLMILALFNDLLRIFH
jgi:regulator of sigma E protease